MFEFYLNEMNMIAHEVALDFSDIHLLAHHFVSIASTLTEYKEPWYDELEHGYLYFTAMPYSKMLTPNFYHLIRQIQTQETELKEMLALRKNKDRDSEIASFAYEVHYNRRSVFQEFYGSLHQLHYIDESVDKISLAELTPDLLAQYSPEEYLWYVNFPNWYDNRLATYLNSQGLIVAFYNYDYDEGSSEFSSGLMGGLMLGYYLNSDNYRLISGRGINFWIDNSYPSFLNSNAERYKVNFKKSSFYLEMKEKYQLEFNVDFYNQAVDGFYWGVESSLLNLQPITKIWEKFELPPIENP